MVADQVKAGRSVAGLGRGLEMAERPLYLWKCQDCFDRGSVSGTSCGEGFSLQAAQRRIKELETKLAAANRASDPLCEDRVMRPRTCARPWRR